MPPASQYRSRQPAAEQTSTRHSSSVPEAHRTTQQPSDAQTAMRRGHTSAKHTVQERRYRHRRCGRSRRPAIDSQRKRPANANAPQENAHKENAGQRLTILFNRRCATNATLPNGRSVVLMSSESSLASPLANRRAKARIRKRKGRSVRAPDARRESDARGPYRLAGITLLNIHNHMRASTIFSQKIHCR